MKNKKLDTDGLIEAILVGILLIGFVVLCVYTAITPTPKENYTTYTCTATFIDGHTKTIYVTKRAKERPPKVDKTTFSGTLHVDSDEGRVYGVTDLCINNKTTFKK